MIGERNMAHAFLTATPIRRGSLEVELRELPWTTDPRSGRPVAVPPLVLIWLEERPLAVRLRDVVAISRFPVDLRAAAFVEAECHAAGLPVVRMYETGLWRLLSRAPRPQFVP